MPFKVTLMWGFSGTGPKRPAFTEIHLYLGAANSTKDSAMNASVTTFMNARTNLMAANVTAIGYRISSYSAPSVPNPTPRKSNYVTATPTPMQTTPLISNAATNFAGSDQPNVAVMATLGNSLLGSRKIYMGGLPDLIIRNAPVGPDWGNVGLPGYQALWTTWQTFLLSGNYGFNALAPLPAGQPAIISYWLQSPTLSGNIAFVLPNTSLYLPTVNKIVHIRGVLMAVSGALRPIGNWRIKAIGPVDASNTYFELDKSTAYTAALVDQPGTVEQVLYAQNPYTTISNYEQVTRRRGVGPVRPRGRSRPRVRRQAK